MEPLNCVVDAAARTAARSGPARSSRRSTAPRPRGRRARARAGEAPHDLPRRRLRPAREPELRLHRRGGAHRQGTPGAGQADLDARGRHARRLLPPDVAQPHRAPASTRDGKLDGAGRTRSSASRSSPGTPFEAVHDQGRHRRRRRSRARPSSPYAIPNVARRAAHDEGRRADAVVALGRALAHGLRGRELPRRARARGGQGSARAPPRAARRAPAPARACSNSPRQKAGWGTPLPAGRARGHRGARSFGSYVAHVAEVSIERGRPRVHRVVVRGRLRPRRQPRHASRAQMEGGIGFGLTAALYGEITLEDGRVQQIELPRLPDAAHARDAGGRGAHRAEHRAADRRRRAGRAAGGAGLVQRAVRADRASASGHYR